METYLDCLPCLLRQVLEASRMCTDDKTVHERIMQEAISVLSRYQSFKNAPHIGRETHRIVQAQTGMPDPYKQIKRRDIQTALRLYPKLERFVQSKQDHLYWALKGAAMGNVLDSAVSFGYDIEKGIEEEMEKPFAVCDFSALKGQLTAAKRILVIGDNAGETVFDGMLLKQLSNYDLTYAARSAPIINDATIEDAKASGLGQYARIISTGCDVPGVLLEECSEAFLEIFNGADIVICKGQGNFETLSDCGRDIYFLLKAKCPVIARLTGVGLNDYVFMHKAV